MVQACTLPAFDPRAWRHFASRCGIEVHYCKGFLDVKFAGIASCIDAPVVVDAIGKIGILLHFANHHVWADRVRSARGDKKGIADVNEMALKEILEGVILRG